MTSANQPALEIKDVTFNYGTRRVLTDVSLTLPFGTVAGLVGQNGSGKSTLFKIITSELHPLTGSVTPKQLDAAYVPQSDEVDWNFPLSVREVVMTGRYGHMNWMRRPSAEDTAAVEAALERTDLVELQDRQIGQLSGGQRKRVFVARGIAQDAHIMLLDEPFAGVDQTTEAMITALLRELAEDGRLVFISTHDLNSVPTFCDTVTMLNRSIVAHGKPDETLTKDNLMATFGSTSRDEHHPEAGAS